MEQRTIKRALISVYDKNSIEQISKRLIELNVEIVSTGGTFDYLISLGIPVKSVEEITGYPSILGGRVKTLHPKSIRRYTIQERSE
jgi:AICAR transformylase/IMP cyclohydrolase PurH (only IMP cyclohydrolase domain in Aful)